MSNEPQDDRENWPGALVNIVFIVAVAAVCVICLVRR